MTLAPQSRRGQAAMEFLMTYGWAILAMLIAVGSIAYMTGFYGKLLPSHCLVGAPFTCVEHVVYANGTIILGLQNGLGTDIQSTNVTIYCNQDPTISRTNISGYLRNQERINTSLLYFTCPATTGQFKANLFVTYTAVGTTTSHTAIGEIRTRVES